MAFSDNLMAMEQQQPWMFRSTFADSWLSEAFTRESETLMTKALQNSISNQYSDDFSSDVFNPFNQVTEAATTATTAARTTTQVQPQTPTVSGGSECETAVSKKRKITGVADVNGEKVTKKRRSRASKRETTTYIAADPENFRQMVQQVTGVRFGSAGDRRRLPVLPIHKPGPQRISNNSIMQTISFMPTLDTSAFLLDQINNNPPMSLDEALVAQPPAANNGPPSVQSQPEWVDGDGGSASTFDFDFFCTNFPILESNVM